MYLLIAVKSRRPVFIIHVNMNDHELFRRGVSS